MKILLAVDGSPNSLDAVTTFIKHLDWFRDPPAVKLVYVHLPVPKIGGMASAVSKDMLERYYREEGDQALAQARKLLEDAKVNFNAEVLVGRPAETIVAQADKEGSALIYMGTHGRDGVSNVVMGSIANRVLHLAKTPVILVK